MAKCYDAEGRELNLGDTVTVRGSVGLFTWEGYLIGEPDKYCVRGTETKACTWAFKDDVIGGL